MLKESMESVEVRQNSVSGVGMVSGSGSTFVISQKQTTAGHIDHVYGVATASDSSSQQSTGAISTAASVRGRSKVWNEFTVTADGKKVMCRLCGDCLAYSNSHSTSSMLKHLKRKHSLDLYPCVNNEDETSGAFLSSPGIDTSRPPNFADRRNRPKPKKFIAKEEDNSIQHGSLLFKDPCVRMKWTDHSDTFLRTFSSLYSDESYTDVTLVAEKNYFKAHRVILSSASEFFDETFKMTPAGQHPIVFLKDVKPLNLRILLDFIYKGEVSIPQALIPGLVKIGKDLRVRGLCDFVWNDQLANNIFQPHNQPQATTTSKVGYTPPPPPLLQGISQQQQSVVGGNMNTNQGTSTVPEVVNTENQTTNQNKLVNFNTGQVRTVFQQIRLPQMQKSQGSFINGTPTTPAPSVSKTYSRLVNIRPTTNNGSPTIVATGSLQRQFRNDNGSVSTGTISSAAAVSTSPPALKRIRIVTSSEAGHSSSPATRVITLGPQQPNSSETVLMVTNEGETMLSTSQGGVTVLTPNASTAFPVVNRTVVKEPNRFNATANNHATSNFSSVQSQPLTILSTNEQQPEEDLDEVVYSIAEISEDQHEVMLGSEGDTMIVCGEDVGDDDQSDSEEMDKKPYLQT